VACCIFHNKHKTCELRLKNSSLSKVAKKTPKKVPVKSLKIPPQEELRPITESSVFAFTQVIVGGFQITGTIPFTHWYDGGIKRLFRKSTSPITQLPVEFTPDMVTKVEIFVKVL